MRAHRLAGDVHAWAWLGEPPERSDPGLAGQCRLQRQQQAWQGWLRGGASRSRTAPALLTAAAAGRRSTRQHQANNRPPAMVQPVCPVRASGGPAPLAPQHSRPLSAAPSSPQATARPMQHAGGSVGGPSQQSPGSRVIYTCTYMLCIYVYKGHTAHPIHPCSPPGGQPVRRPGPHRTAAWLHRLPAATTLPSTAQLNTHTHRAGQGTVETAPQCGHNTARSVGRGDEGLLRRGGGERAEARMREHGRRSRRGRCGWAGHPRGAAKQGTQR